MARVKGAMMTRKRRNKILKAAKGYWGAKSKHFKMAKQAVMKSGNYAFAGRKMKISHFQFFQNILLLHFYMRIFSFFTSIFI